MDIQEIKKQLEQNRQKIDDAQYRTWDIKCRVLDKYDDMLRAVRTIEENMQYVNDDEFIKKTIKSFKSL